jgi:hypothetical protein
VCHFTNVVSAEHFAISLIFHPAHVEHPADRSADMTSSDGRYFISDGEPLPIPKYHDELIDSLTRINLYNPPVQTCSTGWHFQGFFQGPTSIALLFYKLSGFYPDLEFKGQYLLDWAKAYLELFRYGPKEPVKADHCGIANETLASLALTAVISKDASLVQQFCAYLPLVQTSRTAASDEWLYGRAGFLYFLRLLKSAFIDSKPAQVLLNNTIETVVQAITASHELWTWHGKTYLGAAHGAIGIIAQLALSAGNEDGRLDGLLDQILGFQFESGNFQASLGSSALSDELVQFCHGGPGFVLSLQSIKSVKLGSKLLRVIEAVREDTWKRGLLTKTPCLCHGIAGNALALDDESRFNHFLAHMTTAQLDARNWLVNSGCTDKFAGLFGGEAGRAWVWAVADKGLLKTCIGFNDV